MVQKQEIPDNETTVIYFPKEIDSIVEMMTYIFKTENELLKCLSKNE